MATDQKTNEREVLAVFVTYRQVRTNLLGQDQIVPATASRGAKVELFGEDERRLDALGALVPTDSGMSAQEIVDAAVRRALNPYDVPAVPAVVQPSVSPPSLGAAPRQPVLAGVSGESDYAAFVESSTADRVVDRAGNDRAEAQALLDAERARGDKARSTLVERLERVAAGE